jgi:uncharacterized protein (TIGR02246 family)
MQKEKSSPNKKNKSSKETGASDVQSLLSDYETASRNKDLEGLLSLYSPDHVAFDVVPPFSRTGMDEARIAFKEWFDMYEGPIDISFEEVKTHLDRDLAVVHALVHTVGKVQGKTMDGWTRSTLVLKKQNGSWSIIHDHASFPMDMNTMQPIMKPEGKFTM